jgi:RNA-dependent RNA polymerase
MSDQLPSLKHLQDVLVFSRQGERPQPNQMSGGDLDGDLYFAIWDSDLVPTRAMEPMDYSVPSASEYGIGEPGEVTAHHISDFFVKYMKNDNLGRICNAHVAFADLSSEGARCRECIVLAKLASKAVDFCKTGVSAEMPRDLICNTYPDFMENE